MKHPFFTRLGLVLLGAPCLFSTSACAQNALTQTPMLAAPTPIAIVDPTIQFQPFQGWGTSLAWWAHIAGQFPEPARTDILEKSFSLEKGLGLNVVRYNIGGGENPLYLAPNKQFLEVRAAVPGYLDVNGRYDWTADAGQRHVLREAMKRGANRLEAFSNSPPYFMTQSGSASGNHEGRDNIKPESDAAFAAYLAEVTRHFRDVWGVKFDSVEPLNEPSANWWKFGNHQEGAHVDRPHQNALIHATSEALRARGMTTPIAASDESILDDAARTFPFYDGQSLAAMSRINTHSYGGNARAQVSAQALGAGKDLWLSEYGDGDASGLQMARRITQDMRGLHPSAWCYWQVIDNAGGWGFFKNPLVDAKDTAYTINQKFYVMAQYSRFIRPGARFLAVDNRDTLAAFDAKTGTLTLVAVNTEDQNAPLAYDLSGFSKIGKLVQVIRTDAQLKNALLPALPLQGKRLETLNPPHSVTTYVLKGVRFTGAPGFDPQRFYTLKNARDGRILQVGSDSLDESQPVLVAVGAGKTRAQWRVVGLGGSKYQLVNRSSGLALEVGGQSLQSGASVAVYHDKAEAPEKSNQHWRLSLERSGNYKLLNTLSGLALEANENGAAQQAAPRDVSAQQWRIEAIASK